MAEEPCTWSINGAPQTWKQMYEREYDHRIRLNALADLLMDLNRCEHGRHEDDVCGSCGGPSHGNPNMSPDRVLGFTMAAQPIRYPDRWGGLNTNDVASWLSSGSPDPKVGE